MDPWLEGRTHFHVICEKFDNILSLSKSKLQENNDLLLNQAEQPDALRKLCFSDQILTFRYTFSSVPDMCF